MPERVAYPTNGANPPAPVQIRSAIPLTVTDVAYAAAAFAGLDSAANHLQVAGSVVAGTTDKVLVAGAANKKIVVYEVAAMTTGGATDFTGTLAEEGATTDLLQFTGTQYGQVRYTQPFELGVNKDLILYRAAGNTGSNTSDANIVTVSYNIFDA